jgi:hypothetical protein
MYGLWIFYLAWTHLEKVEAEGTLSTASRVLGGPVKVGGLAIDTVVNFTIVTVLFLDWPHEFLVSRRFSRYLHGKDGRRKRITQWVCTHLLDAFDVDGKHCK